MGKFCGECGSELKNNKCPKCDKKETKKVVKIEETKAPSNEGNVFGWGVLGFFVPIVGLILFLVWKNSRKKAANAAGIGALIGFIKNLIIIIISWIIAAISLIPYSVKYNNYHEYPPYTWDEDYDNDIDEDEDEDEDDIETIELSDINTKENFPVLDYFINHFKNIEDKEHRFESKGITVIRDNEKVTIKDYEDNKVLFTFDNVKKVYYHEYDCSGLDTIVIVTNNKAYYIKTDLHKKENIKAVEIKGDYKEYYYTSNHSYTCGGSIIALGKGSDGSFYNLNGETPIDFDNLYYYDDSNNWISISRNTKLNGEYGSVKATVVSSVSTNMIGFIDSYGYAYSYVYDDGAVDNNVLISKLNDSPVKKIECNYSDDTVKLIFENNETYTFEFAMLDY